jgi:hypothetical protein
MHGTDQARETEPLSVGRMRGHCRTWWPDLIRPCLHRTQPAVPGCTPERFALVLSLAVCEGNREVSSRQGDRVPPGRGSGGLQSRRRRSRRWSSDRAAGAQSPNGHHHLGTSAPPHRPPGQADPNGRSARSTAQGEGDSPSRASFAQPADRARFQENQAQGAAAAWLTSGCRGLGAAGVVHPALPPGRGPAGQTRCGTPAAAPSRRRNQHQPLAAPARLVAEGGSWRVRRSGGRRRSAEHNALLAAPGDDDHRGAGLTV